jgi:two-component system chemotaxis response regulator CheB
MVAIGASAGGLVAVRELLSAIPRGFNGTLFVVIHRSPFTHGRLAEVLERSTGHPVVEPADGESIRSGHVYLAPPDQHLIVDRNGLRVIRGPKEHFTRPAVDPLFRSLAAVFGPRSVGVILSGAGQDGHSGLMAIKQAGGIAMVQRPSESQVPSMPKHAIEEDSVDVVLPVHELGRRITALMNGPARRAAGGKA